MAKNKARSQIDSLILDHKTHKTRVKCTLMKTCNMVFESY
jgi:hypothetical protein